VVINNPFSCGRYGNSLRASDPNKTENKKFFILSRNPRRGVENPFIFFPYPHIFQEILQFLLYEDFLLVLFFS
jgi:hypothetical protein